MFFWTKESPAPLSLYQRDSFYLPGNTHLKLLWVFVEYLHFPSTFFTASGSFSINLFKKVSFSCFPEQKKGVF